MLNTTYQTATSKFVARMFSPRRLREAEPRRGRLHEHHERDHEREQPADVAARPTDARQPADTIARRDVRKERVVEHGRELERDVRDDDACEREQHLARQDPVERGRSRGADERRDGEDPLAIAASIRERAEQRRAQRHDERRDRDRARPQHRAVDRIGRDRLREVRRVDERHDQRRERRVRRSRTAPTETIARVPAPFPVAAAVIFATPAAPRRAVFSSSASASLLAVARIAFVREHEFAGLARPGHVARRDAVERLRDPRTPA